MHGGRVQYAIARSVYGQIRYAQGKPGGVPADIIGLGRHLSEIEGFYRVVILRPSLQRTETIVIELNRAPMNEKAFKRQVDHLIHQWAQETLPEQANVILDTAAGSQIEKLDIRKAAEAVENSRAPLPARNSSSVPQENRVTATGARKPQKKGSEINTASAVRVLPSEPGRAINITRHENQVADVQALQAEHLSILIEALELMSTLESGRIEILTDLAKTGRIPSALRLKQEDRLRCILKADELIRKAKMLLTGEGVAGKTALDYIQTPESTSRAKAIQDLRKQISGGRIALEESIVRTKDRALDFDSLIDIEKDINDDPGRRAGLLRPSRYTRSDVIRALEQMNMDEKE